MAACNVAEYLPENPGKSADRLQQVLPLIVSSDQTASIKGRTINDNDGWLTAFIHLERGLRQGCALSMPLYVLTAETMVSNIRANPPIHGIGPPDSEEELKLSQYADDTTLLLSDDESIDEAFNTFDLYERPSGAKINKGKCKGL